TVNVSYPVPVGGSLGPGVDVKPRRWLHPGPNQHFKGSDALWFARGRYGLNDYTRMERQRCVVNAVVQQANPVNVLSRFQAIAEAGKQSLATDIPQRTLPAFLDLATRVQGTKLRSIVFINGEDGFKTGNPDWDVVRSRVNKALNETTEFNQAQTPDPTATEPETPTAEPKSVEMNSACGYDPNKYQELVDNKYLSFCEKSKANYKLCFGKERE
ncbi:MAG: LCP family protein, partial [Propionibacteriaceae bacterium]|nr:LCP family protein [Propionibacteriaceae bacterium]